MKSDIPVICLQRLPIYLNYLKTLPEETEFISSGAIARALGMGEVLVRKDLALTTAVGRPRMGYKMSELIAALEEYLGCNDVKNAVIFGAGEIGKALMAYSGFSNYGIDILAAFDVAEEKIGRNVAGKTILPMYLAKEKLHELGVKLAIICVPAKAAQGVADILAECGIRAILNFAPVQLNLPDGFIVRNIDVAANLAILSSMIQEI